MDENRLDRSIWNDVGDIVIKSYTSAIFDFMNIVSNIVTIFEIKLVKN